MFDLKWEAGKIMEAFVSSVKGGKAIISYAGVETEVTLHPGDRKEIAHLCKLL